MPRRLILWVEVPQFVFMNETDKFINKYDRILP